MSTFHSSLSRFHRRWSFGRVLFALMMIVVLFICGMLLHGWADYKLALSPLTRERLNLALGVILGVMTLIWFVRIFKTPREKVAAMIDEQCADPRRRVLAAAHLERIQAETPMQQFHLDRALDDAAEELKNLPLSSRMPYRAIAKACCGLLLVAAIVMALKFWATEPFNVTAARVFDPSSDTPPYSPLLFEVSPNELNAIYGGEAVAQVTITGGEITDDVVCLIRNKETGKVETATAYQKSPGHYARKFTNTLASVEFAFATGRARSAWHSLDVLLQPKVSGAIVTVQPPAYTGRTKEVFPLESGEIKALEGSTITLEVQSNRPLSGGILSLKPLNDTRDVLAKQVQGDNVSGKSVNFTWIAHASSQISATIKDVRSTPSEMPLRVKVKVMPDQVPVVDLSSPEQMVLATPRTELPFEALVEDDHGLAKVSIVRSLLGYRDRSRTLADAMVKKEFTFKEPLKLEEIGVEVGQILEFYLEAMDRNPSLLGQGVSEVVRVKIISENDYAERLRSKVQLREFTARYRALSDAIRAARKSLDNLDKHADIGDKKSFNEEVKKAQSSHEKAKQLAEKMAKDFQAFAMEDRLADAAKKAAGKLGQNKQDLSKLNLSAGESSTRRAIAEMKKRLGEVQKKSDQVLVDAEIVRKVGRVMEMAATFKKIHRTQKSLVERIGTIAEEVSKGNTTNTAQLANLGRQQELNRKALMDLAGELKKRAAALPPGFEKMQQDTQEFLDTLKQLDIPEPMQAAADFSKKGKSVDTSANAMLALSLMEQLVNKPNNGF